VVRSFAAALGVSAFFFNHVFGFGGADTSFPLFVFVFLSPWESTTTSS
jgi:RND superfamily putative drug exporter